MYTKKTSSVHFLIKSFGKQFLWYVPYVTAVYFAYKHFGYKNIDIKMSIATVLGFAVALLLGFRISASYDRWWEARKIWGGIVNDSRTLIRQLISFIGGSVISNETKQMANYQIAWSYSLKNSLRNLDPLENLDKYLTKDEIDYIRTKNNKPNEILKMMSSLLAKLKETGEIDSFQMVAIDGTIKHLCDDMGMAERINKTVFPTHYRSYIHRGIIIFTIMLPFGMLYSTGPFVILICVLVSFFFFMLENIAYFLQDPFMNRASDIPMTALCRTIEINLLELVENENIPNEIQADKRGILM
jgi:putative membrane protein